MHYVAKNMTSLPQIRAMNQQCLLYESRQLDIGRNWSLSGIYQLAGLCIAEQRYSITPIHLQSRDSCRVHAALLCLPATVGTEYTAEWNVRKGLFMNLAAAQRKCEVDDRLRSHVCISVAFWRLYIFNPLISNWDAKKLPSSTKSVYR